MPRPRTTLPQDAISDARGVLDHDMSERALQAAVMRQAKLLGWHCFHTWNSQHSEGGFPDLLLLKGERCVVAELKREDKKPTTKQAIWLLEFETAGIEAYWWRPSNWSSGEIEAVLRGEEAER